MAEEFHGGICGDTWWNPPSNMFSNGDGWLSTCLMSQLVDGDSVGDEMTSLKENGYVCDMVNSMFFPIDLDSTFDTFRFGNSPTSSSTDWNQSNLFHNGIDGQNFELIIKDDINPKIYEMNLNNFMMDNNNVGQQWSTPMELTTVSSNSSEDSSTMNSDINTNFPINSSTSYLIQTLFDDDDNDPKLIDQNNEIPMSSNGRDFDDKTLRNIQVSLLNSLSSRSRPISKSKKKSNNRAKGIITRVVNEEVCDSNCNLNEQPLAKRPRIETPCPLPTFKVRKEKLGDRITALQQLVSPFGKTDTASVLHEAIEYIKYLHDQVNALSTPYLKNQSGIQQDFNMSKKKKEQGKDLRSKGLCVMPISSTYPIAQETPVDFWTPTFGTTPLL